MAISIIIKEVNIVAIFKEKKNLTALLILLFLLVAIPLTLYLARNPQIFKGRATTLAPSSVAFVGLSGNPPTTSSQNVTLKLAYNQSYGSNTNTSPSTPAPVTSGPTLSVSPAQVAAGGKVTVSWTGVNATDNGWFIDSPNYNMAVYLSSCTSASAAAAASPAATQAPSNITFTASPSQVAVGEKITLSWTGLNATDVNWYFVPLGGTPIYLSTCSSTSYGFPPVSGSCTYVAFSPYIGSGILLEYIVFDLIHYVNGSYATTIRSNQVNLITPTPTPTQYYYYTPPAPTPEPAVPVCGVRGCCSVWNPLGCFSY